MCVESQDNPTYLDNLSIIILWHYRLRYLKFVCLPKLFISLFRKKKFEKLSIYQLSKHTRTICLSKYIYIYIPCHILMFGDYLKSTISLVLDGLFPFVDDHIKITWLFLMKEE